MKSLPPHFRCEWKGELSQSDAAFICRAAVSKIADWKRIAVSSRLAAMKLHPIVLLSWCWSQRLERPIPGRHKVPEAPSKHIASCHIPSWVANPLAGLLPCSHAAVRNMVAPSCAEGAFSNFFRTLHASRSPLHQSCSRSSFATVLLWGAASLWRFCEPVSGKPAVVWYRLWLEPGYLSAFKSENSP